jgi:UDP-2,3-diacylglucosamine pyrophosphatase LpxH
MGSSPIVVVSDIHVGLTDQPVYAFLNFLKWLAELEKGRKVTIQTLNGRKLLEAPQRIILLGDLLELWCPQSNDVTISYRNSFPIFNSLLALKCEKIYVLGNHDEDLSGYEGEYAYENALKFTVVQHYPNDLSPCEVGDKKYFFLHGHQCDKLFERAGPLRELPGIIQQIYNIVFKRYPQIGPVGLILLLCFAAVRITRPDWVTSSPPLFAIFHILWFIFGFLGILWMWTEIQRRVGEYVLKNLAERPKYADVNHFIEHYYEEEKIVKSDRKKEKILSEANVIVFGHTHMPGISPPDVEKTFGKRFVNSGSWVAVEDPKYDTAAVEHRPYNTLVYIDSERPLLLQWDDEKRTVHQLKQYAKGKGMKKKWWQFWKRGESA